jgi:hypothetical protein
MQRILFHLYALAKNQAIMKDVSRTFYQRVMKKLHIARVDSMSLSNSQALELFKPCHPALFCINDGESSTDEDRARALRFLEARFPRKSPYEQDN